MVMTTERKHFSDNESVPSSKRPKTIPSESSDEEFSEESDLKPDQQLQQTNFNLYLETINRKILDFDFEKICSISLSNSNVYGCLVCNKYLRGRSKSSECFLHSINENHHVFINFSTLKFYILPENYELNSKTTESLLDIQRVVNPTYSNDDMKSIYSDKSMSLDLNKNEYRRGFIGINSTSHNDYSNVILQALTHIDILRDYLLLSKEKQFEQLDLSNKFSLLTRKIWSSHLFKPHISSHELMQLIETLSNKKFSLHTSCAQPKDFLLWLLNSLNNELTTNLKTPMISKIFQGKIFQANTNNKLKFWLLTITLPSITLFKDGLKLNTPQLELTDLIEEKNYRFNKLPKVLVLYINRINNDQQIVGIDGSNLNPSIVRFDPSELIIGCKKYRLVANVVYDVDTKELSLTSSEDTSAGTNAKPQDNVHYKIQLLDKLRGQWLEIKDLNLKLIERDLLFLDQSYLQFWEEY